MTIDITMEVLYIEAVNIIHPGCIYSIVYGITKI